MWERIAAAMRFSATASGMYVETVGSQSSPTSVQLELLRAISQRASF